MSNALPLKIELKPSCILLILLSFLHFGAVISLWVSAIPLWLKLILLFLCAISLYYFLGRHVFYYFDRSIYKLAKQADGCWLLHQRHGNCVKAQLLSNSLISPALCIVNFKTLDHARSFSVLMFADSFKKGSLRQLLVLLRFPG
ncbi:MAG: protein YgfX [Gammaproteobacteria bacterium]